MKTLIQALTIAAVTAAALPAMAEKASNPEDIDRDPNSMTCGAFMALDPSGQTSVALLVKSELSNDAAISAMSDPEITAEVMKRCGGREGATVMQAFKM